MIRLLLLFLCTTFSLSAYTLTGRVIKVEDGDTFTVLKKSHQKIGRATIRLWGIDSPETSQPYGQVARKAMVRLVYNKMVRIDVTDQDKYGRLVGRVYLKNTYVNLEMVKQGLAWWYSAYAPYALDLKHAQTVAKKNKEGLWKASKPVPPWDYRQSHPKQAYSSNSNFYSRKSQSKRNDKKSARARGRIHGMGSHRTINTPEQKSDVKQESMDENSSQEDTASYEIFQ
jgi:endonuclease YncB( thermonuclease family)